MKQIFKEGDSKKLRVEVDDKDVASFNGNVVHRVCSTFALAKNIEWATRQYVLEMTEPDEEGIGTSITINHKSPALIGEILEIYSTIESLKGNKLICRYEVRTKERLIAEGTTGQKILKKEKIEKIFSSLPG